MIEMCENWNGESGGCKLWEQGLVADFEIALDGYFKCAQRSVIDDIVCMCYCPDSFFQPKPKN